MKTIGNALLLPAPAKELAWLAVLNDAQSWTDAIRFCSPAPCLMLQVRLGVSEGITTDCTWLVCIQVIAN